MGTATSFNPMPFPLHAKRSRRAFTLIELLCVIAIMAQLAAILFPVFSRARETARRASCQSNLKQIGLGLLQYTQDYDERMPTQQWGANNDEGQDIADYSIGSTGKAGTASASGNNWIIAVQPYTKSWQVFRCPTSQPYSGIYTSYRPSGESDTNYVMNGNSVMVTSGASVQARMIASIPEASSLIWLHERPTRTNRAFLRPRVYLGKFTEEMADGLTPSEIKLFDAVHFDGGNLLFVDGHVKWRQQNKICNVDFGISGSRCGGSYSTGNEIALF